MIQSLSNRNLISVRFSNEIDSDRTEVQRKITFDQAQKKASVTPFSTLAEKSDCGKNSLFDFFYTANTFDVNIGWCLLWLFFSPC